MKMFKDAINGIRTAFNTEKNIRRHFLIGLGVIVGIFLVNGTIYHLILALTAIVLVISFEMMNTSIERLSDMITNDYSEEIRIIKDISAGAVLMTVFFSLATGLIIGLTLN